MKRSPNIPLLVALAHFPVAWLVPYLSGVPATENFYLGLFGSSETFAFAFSLLLYPVFVLLHTLHLAGTLASSPAFWPLCVVASSIFYGLLAAGILAVSRPLRHPRSVA